ncbi:CLUMA_CG017776, isoform A [Clunio marinus]|uniref:DNA repair protein REV1 n=1 Tax=Clunio marinus TaxID=568069 RepID=A0A1J1IYT7_9DIPT|nr:CLUMA_CG017776, isoform A [Clunio marinus]
MKRRPPLDDDNGFAQHGGYMSAKITKLEEQFNTIQSACRQKSKIFEGISIFVNGFTNPSGEELKRIMMEHGGTFHHYQRSHTKFVIASNLPDVKVRTNITRNIVKPEWISDSLKENKLLDYSKYLLYTNKNRAQPQISFKALNKNEYEVKKEEVDPFSLSLQALNDKIKDESIPEGKTGTAVDPNFLEEFLNNSRLHHIATLGSGFKFHINDLRKNHDGIFPEREILKSKLKQSEMKVESSEIVMHIDMDCFFVSVSLKKHPHLKGLPVAVTHSKGRNESEDFTSYSEIASCSYEARAKGLKNGMFVGAALKLCPELKTIPYDFDEYRKTAFILYDTIAKYTLDIEAVSCDELYADLMPLVEECKIEVMDFVTMLRQEIFDKTGCTCSVGVGYNRLQARMTTKEAKPNGQFSLLGMNVEEFMKDKKIRDLPGVGPNTAYQLTQLKIETCDQLQNLPLQTLQQTFGKKFGETLQMMSKGIDDKKLVFEQVRKSVSVEVNYGIRFNEDQEVHLFLKQVTEELSKRLKEISKKGKLLTLKLMIRAKDASKETAKFMGHGHVERISKSVQLLAATDDAIAIQTTVLKLLAAFNIPPYELRGIGVQMSKLDEEKKDNKLLEMFKKVAEKQQNAPIQERIEASPVKIRKISPVKKRGRPSKLSNADRSSNISVADMFSTKKNSRVSAKKTIEMIDPEVLAELPPEIVNEILEEYQMPEEVEEIPEIEEISEEKNDENIFLQSNWRQVTKSLIDNNESAEQIKNDAASLVRIKNIDLIYLVMRFLHRIIEECDDESLAWRENYNEIAESVQEEMQKIYKKKLSIPKKFI